MMYLKFDTQEEAEAALINAGFVIGEYRDKFWPKPSLMKNRAKGNGTIFRIPLPVVYLENGDVIEEYKDGWHVNVFDCEHIPELAQWELPEPPTTPYNVRA